MIVFGQLNYIKTRWFHAIFMPVMIEFSRCIGTYLSAKFEFKKLNNGWCFKIGETKDEKEFEIGYTTKMATGDFSKTSATGDYSTASATGDCGVASATGDYSVASVTGNCGAALITGYKGTSITGSKKSVAVAWGYESKAKGILGAYLVFADWRRDDEYNDWTFHGAKMVQVDGKEIKEDTLYMLKDGNIIEAEEET